MTPANELPPRRNPEHPPRELPPMHIPEHLQAELTDSTVRIIREWTSWTAEQGFTLKPDAPDLVLVPERSAPPATAGLRRLQEVQHIPLPPLRRIGGLGTETVLEYVRELDEQNVDVPAAGLGEHADEEDLTKFWHWLEETQNPKVRHTIEQLRRLRAELPIDSTEPINIVILDDTRHHGQVTRGIAPGFLRAALGEGNFTYEPDQTQLVFPDSPGWLPEIITTSFPGGLSTEHTEMLVELSKGTADTLGAPSTPIDSVDTMQQVARTTQQHVQMRQPESVIQNPFPTIYGEYGDNLLQLPQQLIQAIESAVMSRQDQILRELQVEK